MKLTSKQWKRARTYGAVGVIGLGVLACVTPPLETPKTSNVGVNTIIIPQNLRNKVDVLFLIDNSNSMDSMQSELKSRFQQFFQPFIDLANAGTFADMNIGVVTSDYGAGATGAPGCGMSPGGQQGRLQGRGVKADASCKNPVGANFVHYVFDQGGSSTVNNLPMGQNLLTTFTCMASVGANGCGFEHQLEAVYAALHNNLPDNMGFLRDDALLVVVFLTNEDDASAPPDSDVFDKNKTAQYGYEDSYSRQTRFAVMCNYGMPAMLQFPPYADSGGPLMGCVAAPNPGGGGPGKQYDIQRYIDLFGKPPQAGGVKANPLSDVVLVGIDAPDPAASMDEGGPGFFQVILSNPGTPAGTAYPSCPQLNDQGNPPCVPVLQHSCVGSNPNFFGDPSVRLNTVIRSAKNHKISSICADDYTPALKSAAGLIVSQLGGGCIPNKLPPDTSVMSCAQNSDCPGGDGLCVNGGCLKTDCTVQDVTTQADGTVSTTEIMACPNNGPNPAGMGMVPPCWRIEPKMTCGSSSPDGVGLTIDRGGQPAPPATAAQVSCAFKG